MKNPELQIIVKGKNIQDFNVTTDKAGMTIEKIVISENPDYIILCMNISNNASAGTYPITFTKGIISAIINYELKEKMSDSNVVQGLNSNDFIYLLIPDRFCNGDTTNDKVKGMNDSIFSRDMLFSRHGGDIAGIMKHMDYFNELGVTTLWPTPVFESNQPFASYHGYAITDHYKVDPRLGTNSLYKEFVSKCHENKLKIIMDVVYNHIGNEHWIYKDLPYKNWIHQNDTFIKTNYHDAVWMDPYVSDTDRTRYTNGWFDKHMPDLNQNDSLLATYLIQNTIWWISYTGVDALRFDTYPYPDQDFMAKLIKAVLAEYPEIGMFGETWVSGIANQAFYTKGSGLDNPYNPQLPGVTDFQLFYAMNNALTKDFGWTDGVSAIYYCLANDFLYKDPFKNVIFLDNHDQSRFFSVAGENIDKYKMGMALLLTIRGIPCMYYGTEILMKNFGSPDEKLREDFPGGWSKDKQNKFLSERRNSLENVAFSYVKKLSLYRKNNSVFQNGKLKQFIPENGVYVYFRYDDKKTVMIIVNQNKENQEVQLAKFKEMINGYTNALDIITDEKISSLDKINVLPYSATILELLK